MSIERLTAEDEMVLWPDEVWPQDIGAIAILDGGTLRDADGQFRIDTVRRAIEARLHLAPRFRQVLRVPRRRLGAPLWVDAPAFDIAEHVGVVPLPAPGDEAALLLAVEGLRRRRLDRSRPLWEMWFLPGLPEGRVGLFVRIHHVIADGIAGVATIGAFLDPTPDAITAPGPSWAPAPPPTTRQLFLDHVRRRVRGLSRALSRLVHPVARLREARAAWPALRELLAEGRVVETGIDRLVGPDRSLALVRSRLDLFRDVARACDATVNDVLLTVTAGGLRRLLGSRGEAVDGLVLRVYVPITLRRGHFAEARGNRISQMVVPLPVGVADPGRRLRRIAAETTRRKALSRPSLGKLPSRGFAGRMFLKLLDRHRVNVTTANVPGPSTRLYLAGAEVLEVFPLLNLIGRVTLGLGAMSYAGAFDLLAVADRDACPDIDVFAAGVRDDLRTLEASVRAGARPGPEPAPLAAVAG